MAGEWAEPFLRLGGIAGRTTEGAAVKAAKPFPESVTKPYRYSCCALLQNLREAQRQLLLVSRHQ